MSSGDRETDALFSPQVVWCEREQRRRDILKISERDNEDGDDGRRGMVMCMGIMYMAAMGVCGMVLVVGSTLEYLSSQVGMTSTELGTIF